MGQFTTFVANHWLLWAAFFLVLLALLVVEARAKAGGGRTVNPQAAISLINHEHAVVLDVCTPDEFKSGHIINSINIPIDTLDSKLDKLKKYKKKPLIVVCAAGIRAQKAAKLLAKNEFANVYVLGGGLKAWKQAD